MDVSLFTSCRQRVVDNCSKVIVGKEDAIQLVFTCFLCSGHVLLEDVPGTGKNDAAARLFQNHRRKIQTHPVHPLFSLAKSRSM